MTDDEVTRSLTNAMHSLNDTAKKLELIYESIDENACPVCSCAKQLTKFDIEIIEETRNFLIEKSRDSDRDERIIAATKAIGIAMTTMGKAHSLRIIADAAHEGFEAIAEARVQQIITGPEGQGIKEALEKALSDAGLTKHKFDPTKVN